MTLFWQTSCTSTRLREAYAINIILLPETCLKGKTSCCRISFVFIPKMKGCLILMVRILFCSLQHIDMVVVPWVKCWKSIKLRPSLHNTYLVSSLILWYLNFQQILNVMSIMDLLQKCCQMLYFRARGQKLVGSVVENDREIDVSSEDMNIHFWTASDIDFNPSKYATDQYRHLKSPL